VLLDDWFIRYHRFKVSPVEIRFNQSTNEFIDMKEKTVSSKALSSP